MEETNYLEGIDTEIKLDDAIDMRLPELHRTEPHMNGKAGQLYEVIDGSGNLVLPETDPKRIVENGGLIVRGNKLTIGLATPLHLVKSKLQKIALAGNRVVTVKDGRREMKFDVAHLIKNRFDLRRSVPLSSKNLESD